MDQAQTSSLPPPRPDQICVSVSAIEGGLITLPDHCFVTPSNPADKRTVPSLAFLVQHPGSSIFSEDGTVKKPLQMMFDLGLRSELGRYIPQAQSHLKQNRVPYRLDPGVAKQLRDGAVNPDNIDAVILSHVHYDHHGDPEDFKNAKCVVGNSARDILRNGVPGKGSHQAFDPNLLPTDRTLELPRAVNNSSVKAAQSDGTSFKWEWNPVGPFPNGIDMFGDGSAYIIDSPGHLPGHVNLLCRTEANKWLFLGGDTGHDVRLLTGEKEIGTWENEHGDTLCIHLDREVAAESIQRVRELMELNKRDEQKVEVILAHDNVWFEKNQGRMFPKAL
jgi:glyoxylase-like metal-dependent hydrolase (beta-lactamase superfamily II)